MNLQMERITTDMTDKNETKRVNLWIHPGNQTEEKVYAYMLNAKRKGMQYMEYITDCILAYEEGDVMQLRSADIDVLADKIAEKIGKSIEGSIKNKSYD